MRSDKPRPRQLLVHHVAKRLGRPARTVRYWAQTGRLRAQRVGRKIWQFDPADVESLRSYLCAARAENGGLS